MTFSALVTQMPVLLSCVGFIVLAQPHAANGELTNSRFISALMGVCCIDKAIPGQHKHFRNSKCLHAEKGHHTGGGGGISVMR